MVARSRGAKFRTKGKVVEGRTLDDSHLAQVAMIDVYEWLGFTDTASYLSTLQKEKARIFERAKY